MAEFDYYQTLGVSPEAEEVVITAAYRALAQRYHPDKWFGDPTFAHNRMTQINEAYRILRDAETRKVYDRSRQESSSNQSFSAQDEDETEKAHAFDQALDEQESNWRVAESVYPDLKQLRQSLARISHQLAFEFVVVLLEKRQFSNRLQLANNLERDFLERYFGTNAEVISFGRSLIFSGRRDAALALNRIISVLGSESPPEVLIAKIQADFGIRNAAPPSNNVRSNDQTASQPSVIPKRSTTRVMAARIAFAMVIAITLTLALPQLGKVLQDIVAVTKVTPSFDLKLYSSLNSFASGTLNLSSVESKQWADRMIEEHPSFDFRTFEQIYNHAFASSGLDFTRLEAAKWAKERLVDPRNFDLDRFKDLRHYALSKEGLNLSKEESIKWALKKMRDGK